MITSLPAVPLLDMPGDPPRQDVHKAGHDRVPFARGAASAVSNRIASASSVASRATAEAAGVARAGEGRTAF
jgi:hypothetical protein